MPFSSGTPNGPKGPTGAVASAGPLVAHVLPGELIWAPEVVSSEGLSVASHFWLGEAASDEYLRGGEYSVPQYSPHAVGRAVGPLALDQTLRFCEALGDRIARYKSVALRTPPGDAAARANAAVLLGAYLILRRAWTTGQAAAALPCEAKTTFPCSWAGLPNSGPPQPDVMRVADCWSGVQLARDRNWLPADTLEDALKTALACGQYRRMALEYDATWIWPGRVLVGADPMTTIFDPNPDTCNAMFNPRPPGSEMLKEFASEGSDAGDPPLSPKRCFSAQSFRSQNSIIKTVSKAMILVRTVSGRALLEGSNSSGATASVMEDIARQISPGAESSCSTNRMNEARGRKAKGKPAEQLKKLSGDQGAIGREFELEIESVAPSSCHTVCKDYDFTPRTSPPSPYTPKDYISWMKDRNVVLVVRVNHGDESGLAELGGSYDPQVMKRNDLVHLDLPVPDKKGGVPDAYSIRTMLQRAASESLRKGFCDKEPAVLIHCKGGFGRSIVFACCLLIWEHDIPGRSLLGWVRIVRPGAITTPEQERFLCRLCGRADLQRFLGQSHLCCAVS